MPEPARELIVTRVALLELEDERRLAKEGYELLDEKRILLAAAIRRELARLETLRRASRAAERDAVSALQAAVRRHGLDELCVYPALSTRGDQLTIEQSRLLGLELLEARFTPAPPREGARLEGGDPVHPSPEARACARAYRRWIEPLAALAACTVSLRRLVREFIRTERRARAIENILLPEIASVVRLIEERLGELDQEEIARLRSPLARSKPRDDHPDVAGGSAP